MGKPVRDYILVKREVAETTTKSGLVIPGTSVEKSCTGTVVSFGSGRVTANGTVVPLEVQEGDKVIFLKQMALEVKVDEEDLVLLREDHLVFNYNR